jgi:hypothetical protein
MCGKTGIATLGGAFRDVMQTRGAQGAVLQIRRSLVRSQLMSVDFSLT